MESNQLGYVISDLVSPDNDGSLLVVVFGEGCWCILSLLWLDGLPLLRLYCTHSLAVELVIVDAREDTCPCVQSRVGS